VLGKCSGLWLFIGCLIAVGCAPRATASRPTPQLAPTATAARASSLVVSTDVPALPRAVTSFGAALHGGALFAYGGYFGTPHEYSREGQSGDLSRIDLERRSVVTLASGPGVQGAQLVSTPQGLLRVGGMRAENTAGEPERVVSLTDVARFDGGLNSWRALPPLPVARSSHAAVVLDDKLYVLGGWTLSGIRNTGELARETLVLDLEAGSYTTLRQPFRARALAAAVLDDKIVVIGGLDESGTSLKEVHVLDPATGVWSSGPEYPEDAFGIAASSDGRALFASARDGLVYQLSSVTGPWQAVGALAFPRFFHQLLTLDETHVVALGGISGMHRGDRVAHIEVLDLASTAPRVLSWTLHNPSHAKNRQGMQVLDDALVVFGGNRSLTHDFAPEDFLTEAYALQLASLKVESLPAFPVPRQTVQTAALEGQLLAFGGFGLDGDKPREHADSYLLDMGTERWAPYASALPAPRTQFGLVEREGELWVFGGLEDDPAHEATRDPTQPTSVLHGIAGEPLTVSEATLPRPRRAFGGALLDDHYYLVGGMAEGLGAVRECDVFDFQSTRWSTIACPAPRISPQLVALDGKLYLAGGSALGASEPNASIEVYDPKAGSWSTLLRAIPIEPRHLSMRVYRHALLLFSSHRQDDTAQLALVVPPLNPRPRAGPVAILRRDQSATRWAHEVSRANPR